MAKKSSIGVSTLFAAAAGVVAGAVGMFLSDKDNRRKVGREVRHLERVVERDLRKASRKVKSATKGSKKRAR